MTTVTNKNGIEFDIDALVTDVNGKMDRDGLNAIASVCVESYQNGSSWYSVYSDGWCEQGGAITSGNSVTYLQPFVSSTYSLLLTCRYGGTTSTDNIWVTYLDKTATGFTTPNSVDSTHILVKQWVASGYIR